MFAPFPKISYTSLIKFYCQTSSFNTIMSNNQSQQHDNVIKHLSVMKGN